MRKSKQPKVQPKFGVRLRAARLAAGLTQKALAEQAHITPVYLCLLEHGRYDPSLELALFLSKLVNEDLCCGLVKL